MPTPAEIMDMSASLLNDTAQTRFTDAAQLPYLNMALRNLQEEFELNNIPVTNETSTVIEVDTGVVVIGFGTTPALPSNLIEIQQLWQSFRGQNNWIPINNKKEFLPHYLESIPTNQFIAWAWMSNEIRLTESNQDNDIKLDYIQSLFSTIAIGVINTELGAKYKNIMSYLGFRTAALCAYFIGENETRYEALTEEANHSLSVSMGISVKGGQSIGVRRRPYRENLKRRAVV